MSGERITEILLWVGTAGIIGTVLLGIPAFLLGVVGGIEILAVGLAGLIIGLVGEFTLEPPRERMKRLTVTDIVEQSTDLEPRETCPKCSGSVYVESADPLEEYCINHPCDYYRAEGGSGVVRE